MKSVVVVLGLVAAVCCLVGSATAMPRFAARAGAPCAMWHVDPSGGGMRNDFGRMFAETKVALEDLGLPEGALPFNARVSDSIALGSDLRVLYQHVQRPDREQPRISSFYLMEASLYFAPDLWDYVTLYAAPTLHGGDSLLFEASGIVRLPWEGLYFKIGRFTPAYGLKIPARRDADAGL